MALENSKTKSWAICDESPEVTVLPSKFEYDEFQNYLNREQNYLKISEPSAPTSYSNLEMNLDDLPDSLLTEILVRLPAKSIARYKCVSKGWLALISHRTFLPRHLYLQRDDPNPNLMEPTQSHRLKRQNSTWKSSLPKLEWREFELSLDSFPPDFDDSIYLSYNRRGLAYKGKLYWMHNSYTHNFMFALDPFSNGDYFEVVDLPSKLGGVLGVSQEGRLLMFMNMFCGYINIWELIDDEVEGGVGKWCEIVSLPKNELKVLNDPWIAQRIRSGNQWFFEVACDPSNDDICYLESYTKHDNVVLKRNIGTNTVEKVILNNQWNNHFVTAFRYMVPRWPTPVSKINDKSTTTMTKSNSKVVLFARDLRSTRF